MNEVESGRLAERPGSVGVGALAVLAVVTLLMTSASFAVAKDVARAPAIGASQWINSAPLRPDSLRGRVVLVEFWTFGCVNCLRTVPAMRVLHRRLGGRDVVVIGVHTPEFDHERNPANVREAVKRLGIEFPVALDPDGAVWKAFGNRYWPALYVIDRRGLIRDTHIGELHVGTPAYERVIGLIERLRLEGLECPPFLKPRVMAGFSGPRRILHAQEPVHG